MATVTTRVEGSTTPEIQWEIGLTWEDRKRMYQANIIGRDMVLGRVIVQTDRMIEYLATAPQRLAPGERPQGLGAIRAWSEQDAITEVQLYSRPLAHLDSLAEQVATWVYSGVEPASASPAAASGGYERSSAPPPDPLSLLSRSRGTGEGENGASPPAPLRDGEGSNGNGNGEGEGEGGPLASESPGQPTPSTGETG